MSPPITTGLQAHYDADAIIGLADNDPIGQWDDISGNLRHVTASGTARPIYRTGVLNGKPVVRFDGVNDWLRFAGGLADRFSQPNTIYAVAQSNILTGVRPLYSGDLVGERHQLVIRGDDVGDPWRLFAGTVRDVASADINSHFITTVWNGASSQFRLSGVQTNPGGTVGTQSLRLFSVGSDHAGTSFWSGDIAEILVYNAAHSAQEISDTEDYLETKWFGGPISIDVAQVIEAETTNPITPLIFRQVAVGPVSESEIANSITPIISRSVNVGTAIEAETAQAIIATTARQVTVGQANETESANAIQPTTSREVVIGQASESELAQAITSVSPRDVSVGQATERELANSITPAIGRMIPIGQATEAEVAQSITPLTQRAVLVGQATEIELARFISSVKPIFVPVQTAVERELARVVTPFAGEQFLPELTCTVLSLNIECEVI